MSTVRSLRFPPDVRHLADVRAFAAHAADELGATVDRDDLALVVGELAANAAIHQAGEAEIRLSGLEGGRLLVEVLDTDDSIPQAVVVEPWTTDGHRGLFLVEAVSEAWGAESAPSGKRVWARLAPAHDRGAVSPRS